MSIEKGTASAGTRKRVLHFLCHGEIGGQERAVYQLLKAFLGDDELTFGVALGRDRGPYAEKIKALGVPVVPLGLDGGFSLNYDPNVIRAMRGYDVHHFPDPSPNYLLYSLLAGGQIRRTVIRRGGMKPLGELGPKKRLKLALTGALLRRAVDGHAANTANAARSVREQYGVQGRPVTVLYNGIDFSLLRPGRSRAEARAAHGLEEGAFVVATACRLVAWKRVDLLLRAFARCEAAPKRLLVFGDGPERGRLEALAVALGVAEEVRFVGMAPDMAAHYPAFDAFVLASTAAESFGNAVVEAMHARVPSVVMADADGLREHVQHRETGYVAQDEWDLARQLEAIRLDPDGAHAVAARGGASVEERYSLENMRRGYKNFFRLVCGEPLLSDSPLPEPLLSRRSAE